MAIDLQKIEEKFNALIDNPNSVTDFDQWLEARRSIPPDAKLPVNGFGIDWKYFFGGSSGRTFDIYYEAKINGNRVEKHASNRGVKYSIGNIDEAKKKYKTETELLEACGRRQNKL